MEEVTEKTANPDETELTQTVEETAKKLKQLVEKTTIEKKYNEALQMLDT